MKKLRTISIVAITATLFTIALSIYGVGAKLHYGVTYVCENSTSEKIAAEKIVFHLNNTMTIMLNDGNSFEKPIFIKDDRAYTDKECTEELAMVYSGEFIPFSAPNEYKINGYCYSPFMKAIMIGSLICSIIGFCCVIMCLIFFIIKTRKPNN